MSEQIHQYAKYTVLATIIATLVSAGVALYIHYDSKELQVEELARETQKDNEKKMALLTIKQVQLTPVDFEIPSSFYVEIENGNFIEAKDIIVLIDFGESKIEQCSVKSSEQSHVKSNEDDFILKLNVNELLKNESLYVNCLTTLPVFRKVLVTGGNVGFDKELTYTSFKEQLEEDPPSYWYVFFSILVSIFFVYLFVALISAMKKILGPE